MVDIPENLVKFEAGTWWLWEAGHRLIPLLCLGFVRRTKSKVDGFKLTFVWLNNDGVLVKVHPKWPAKLQPIPEGEESFDWAASADERLGYRPFANADEFQPFADYWLQFKSEELSRSKVTCITNYGVALGSNETVLVKWDVLFRDHQFVGGPWKPAGLRLRK